MHDVGINEPTEANRSVLFFSPTDEQDLITNKILPFFCSCPILRNCDNGKIHTNDGVQKFGSDGDVGQQQMDNERRWK